MLANRILPTHDCAVCSKFGTLTCERCGETYCSKMCQVADWREHRHICMPMPRLLQRSESNTVQFPINRMLMDLSCNANTTSFDATDATFGNVSEHSLQGDLGQMSKEQIIKLSSQLSEMQIEAQASKMTDMGEMRGMSTPPPLPKKANDAVKIVARVTGVDENANHTATVQDSVQSKQLSPKPPKVVTSPKAAVLTSPKAAVLTSPKAAVVTPPEPPKKKQQNFKPSVQAIRQTMHVLIVHVANHQTVFVIPSCMVEEWLALIVRTNQYAKEAENLQKPPEVGYIVLAKQKSNGTYSRAMIKRIKAQDEIAKVEFLEFGFTEVVNFTDLKCLSEELVNTPRLVNMITLQGVPDEMENAQEVIQFLTKYQDDRIELIVKQMDPIEKSNVSVHFRAILVDSVQFSVVNEMVKELVSIEPQQKMEFDDIPSEALQSEPAPVSVPERLEIEYIGFSGEYIELLVLDNSFMDIGCFSAIKVSDMTKLGENDGFINKNVADIESGVPFCPSDGETCLAQSADDKRWYRATCQTKIDSNTYNLLYIDYGNMEAVKVDRIRELKKEHSFPCITSLCFIDGLGDKLSPNVVARLKQLIQPYSKLTFDEAKYNGEDALCKSREIINTLKNEGII